jgi:hypothetical protein
MMSSETPDEVDLIDPDDLVPDVDDQDPPGGDDE